MRSNDEHDIQCAIHDYLTMMGIFHYAIPNGGNRHLYTAVKLKKEGVLAGVSDLCIMLQNKPVFAEVKTKKGTQQKSQKEFQNNVERLGFEYLIWRSLDDAINWVKNNA